MKPQSDVTTNELVKDLFNDKRYCEILLPNKDYSVVIEYARNSKAYFTYCYNSISGTYMGLRADSFIDSLRGLLRVCPDFFMDFDCSDYRRSLNRLGFIQVEPNVMP